MTTTGTANYIGCMGRYWSADEDRILTETLDQSAAVVAERLGRKPTAVQARRIERGLKSLRTGGYWTDEQKQSLAEMWGWSVQEAAKRLGRTEASVKKQRSRMIMAVYNARSRTCEHCGKQFAVSDTAIAGRWCSRTCQWQDNPNQYPLRKPRRVTPSVVISCLVCRQEFTATLGRKYCSNVCYLKRKERPTSTKLCKECSGEYQGTENRVFCSDACSSKHARRKYKRAYGNKYRHRARKAGVLYEPINILTVFERDGWRCQICGVKTPKRLRGKNEDRSPELDHRIPIAMGGDHTYGNVQCACRACNLKKLDRKILGQLPLFPDLGKSTRRARRRRDIA
jgi:hypothetical protein